MDAAGEPASCSYLLVVIDFLRIFVVFINMGPMAMASMGAKISKRYSSYKSQPKVLKLVLNFPPNGPHIYSWYIPTVYNLINHGNKWSTYVFSVQLQPMALVCYHKLYIIFVPKIVMNLYNCLQFENKIPTYLPTYLPHKLHLGFLKFWVQDF